MSTNLLPVYAVFGGLAFVAFVVFILVLINLCQHRGACCFKKAEEERRERARTAVMKRSSTPFDHICAKKRPSLEELPLQK